MFAFEPNAIARLMAVTVLPAADPGETTAIVFQFDASIFWITRVRKTLYALRTGSCALEIILLAPKFSKLQATFSTARLLKRRLCWASLVLAQKRVLALALPQGHRRLFEPVLRLV